MGCRRRSKPSRMKRYTMPVATKSGPATKPHASMARVTVPVRLWVSMIVMIKMLHIRRWLCLCVGCARVFSTWSRESSGENLREVCRDREEPGDAKVKAGRKIGPDSKETYTGD